ncbi:MAG: translocation/assembly module TamB domain-containing protein, partial [Muribaculaceae bacterium]|nr:translocation/assembly module TamB domain-containing protein [Muribaculaceae bacterium]
MTIKVVKGSYKVLRTILFTAITAVVAFYIGIYVLLSAPPFQNYIRREAEKELTKFLGGDVKIGEVSIFPFNEVRLKNVEFFTPYGERCIYVERLGAGIRLSRLVTDRKIEITYAELVGFKGSVIQKEEGAPLNIAYIFDALSPKDKTKPPTKFDLKIYNIVIRRSELSFDRIWKKPLGMGKFDPSHIRLDQLMADLTMPRVKNDDFIIDLRRLSFNAGDSFNVRRMSLKSHITSTGIELQDLIIDAARAEFRLADFSLRFKSFAEIKEALADRSHTIELTGKDVHPEDFKFFYPELGNIPGMYDLKLTLAGNMEGVEIEDLDIQDRQGMGMIRLAGRVTNLRERQRMEIDVIRLNLDLSADRIDGIVKAIRLPQNKSTENFITISRRLGDLRLAVQGKYSAYSGSVEATGEVTTGLGDLTFDAEGVISGKSRIEGAFDFATPSFNLGRLLDNDILGETSFTADGRVSVNGMDIEGNVNVEMGYVDFRDNRIDNISLQALKNGPEFSTSVDIDDQVVNLNLNGNGILSGMDTQFNIRGEVNGFYPAALGIFPKYDGYMAKFGIAADISGVNPDNMSGEVHIDGFSFTGSEGKGVRLKGVDIVADYYEAIVHVGDSLTESQRHRRIDLSTDFLTASVDGNFKFSELIPGVRNLLSREMTTLIPPPDGSHIYSGNAEVRVKVFGESPLPGFLKLPVRPLADIDLKAEIDLDEGKLGLDLTAPYLLQGTNRLITGTRLFAFAEEGRGLSASFNTVYPVKNDKASLELSMTASHDKAFVDLGWRMVKNRSASGNIVLEAGMKSNIVTGKPELALTITPSSFRLGPSEWNIDRSEILYADKKVSIDNLRIAHDGQFVEIDGCASADPADLMTVRLAEIDLDYIFSILNINYVSFGGIASGEIIASSVFTKMPIAQTRRLDVKDLSYNDAIIGDADIYSCWNNQDQEVEIHADVKEKGMGKARIDGGVFVTRDSLSFDMKAEKINIGFLKPFMSAFTSDVGGRASGDVKLFGSFKDIDLTGRAYADSIYMKVDYTNVYYHGNDSVILDPGEIRIPSFTLHDRYGNSAVFSGTVRHTYFHDPEFDFKLSNARNLLCYDTNSHLNPDWYGTIFASGSGTLKGRPGIVAMEMDMTTEANSDFTFVLSDTQTALDYTFLTFSDKRKKEREEVIEVEETFEERFEKKREEELSAPTIFAMDLRATVTPAAKMNLIMDPAAGDKITARGGGPLLIHYDTESDEMMMYGKYT